jgi:hypothetical protein
VTTRLVNTLAKAGVPGWALSVLAVLAMVTPMLWALSTRVPNLVETPLTSDRGERIAVPVELSYLDYPGTTKAHVAKMNLHLGNLEVLVRRRTIQILVANYVTTPRLESAELAVVGTGCRFETPARSEWPDNATLPFVRQRGCVPLQGTPTGGLDLTVRFAGPGRVGLWTYRPPGPPTDSNIIYLPDPSWSDLGLKVELRGNYLDWAGRSGYRRADLLAYVWNVSAGSTWVWIATAVAVALLVLGAAAISSARRDRITRVVAPRLAAAGFLWAAGLSLLYVVLVPPFQAPDEPSHFLGYGYVTDNPELQNEAARWGWLTHSERLRGHPEERFRPLDMGHPYLVSWRLVSPVGFGRSSITVPLWRRLSVLLKELPAPRQFLILRLVNATIFSFAIAGCVAMVSLLSAVRRPESAIAMLLLVPTLPFFATYVSNYAPAVAAYALIASACLMLYVDGPRSHFAGFPLGLGLALAIASTRSALPMAVLVSIVGMGRLIIGGTDKGLVPAAIFWGGMAAGVTALNWLLTERYVEGVVADLARTAPRSGAALSVVVSHPLLAAMAGLAVATLMEAGSARLRRHSGGWVRQAIERAMGPACLIGIVGLSGTLIASVFLPLPHLTPAVGTSTTGGTYVLQAVATAASPFRLRDPDFLMSTTFWGAFGWVDTILPDVVLGMLSISGAFATVVMLRRIAVRKDVRRFCWMTALLVAFFATVSVYAAAAFSSAPDLHGRYLIGPYLLAVMLIWSPALCFEAPEGVITDAGCDWVARAAWSVFGVGHACALVAIVTRYF